MKKRFGKFGKHRLKEIILLTLTLGILGAGAFFLWVASFKIPDLSAFTERKVSQSTKIYDRAGEILLYDVNRGVKRTVVTGGDISKNIKNATVAIEDSEFYEHRGIKPLSFLRAVLVNVREGRLSQGGSTLTQQVIKNSLLTSEKKISRKIKEWVLALKLERVLAKSEILTIYLNEAPYGGNVYGIEEASETFFGKKASALTVAESAYLAALPNAPSYYSPFGSHRSELERRKNLVLAKMLEKGFLKQDEYEEALSEKVAWKPPENRGLKAPHFVMFIRAYLEEKYGRERVDEGGLKVITTLNYKLQETAEKLAREYAQENEKNFNAENAAAVALDPKTGEILAMVGSRDYFDKEIDGNFNVALARRQPGSSFKPIVYAEALNRGYTPETVLFDLPTEFSTECNPDGTPIRAGNEEKCYMPVNFDGKYRGPLSFRSALAESRNIPAIQVFYLAGLQNALRLAKNMGISSLSDINRYGLTLVLGGGEVSLLDLASAYGVFANSGVRNPYTGILRVEDKDGGVLENFEQKGVEVLPEQTALRINDILSDNVARAPEFGERSALFIEERPVAVKTGTTDDYRDAWILGYTPQVVVGAWAGNNDNSPMEKKIAGFIIAPLWNALMKETLKEYPIEPFKKPDVADKSSLKPALAGFWQGGIAYFVNKLSPNELATEFTPKDLREEKVVKQVHSILYWVNKDNPLGPSPANPEDDPQFRLWEYPIRKWAAENGIVEETISIIPTALDSMHQPEFSPKITITNPTDSLRYERGARLVITVQVVGKFPIAKVDYFLNDNFIGTSASYPWSLGFVPLEADEVLKESENEIRAVAYDSVGNRGETRVSFRILAN